jgi:hypothetical protein
MKEPLKVIRYAKARHDLPDFNIRKDDHVFQLSDGRRIVFRKPAGQEEDVDLNEIHQLLPQNTDDPLALAEAQELERAIKEYLAQWDPKKLD